MKSSHFWITCSTCGCGIVAVGIDRIGIGGAGELMAMMGLQRLFVSCLDISNRNCSDGNCILGVIRKWFMKKISHKISC